jgi:hypothetical protein
MIMIDYNDDNDDNDDKDEMLYLSAESTAFTMSE